MKKEVLFNGLVCRIIGKICVDSGSILIGDPLYYLHGGIEGLPKCIGNGWGEFEQRKPPKKHYFPLTFDSGEEGVGLYTRTYYGDGTYPVIGLFGKNEDRPQAIMIDFN